MKAILFGLVALSLLTGCAKTARIPATDLTFISIQGEDSILKARFSADRQLTTLFATYEGENQLPPLLTCSLNGDRDLSVNHRISLSAAGTVTPDTDQAEGHRFGYVSTLLLMEKDSSGSTYGVSLDKVRRALPVNQEVSCSVAITAYGYNAYYTGEMKIPAKKFLQALERPQY